MVTAAASKIAQKGLLSLLIDLSILKNDQIRKNDQSGGKFVIGV
jgi:hypothetical protein